MDLKTLQADVWVFDPVNLVKPLYTRQSWTQLTNNDKQLRIRYWDCGCWWMATWVKATRDSDKKEFVPASGFVVR